VLNMVFTGISNLIDSIKSQCINFGSCQPATCIHCYAEWCSYWVDRQVKISWMLLYS